jgi:preprotein translocase SecE subunit
VADSPAKKKRLVKNPETFRERAVKATEASEQPKRTTRVRQTVGGGIAKPFRPVGRGLQKLFRYQPFKFIGWVFKIIGRIIFPKYFRNSWKELRLVQWPGWKLSRQLTSAVLIFAVVFGAAIAIVDYGLDKLFKDILLK